MQKISCLLFTIVLSYAGLRGQQRPELVLPVTHSSGINVIRYSYDNQYLLTASEDKTAKIWELSSGKLLQDLKGHTGGIVAAEFSRDNNYVLTVGNAGAVGAKDLLARLWKVSTGELVQTYAHESDIHYGTFSSNGKLVVTCSEDNTAKLWEAVSGKLLFTLEPKASDIQKVVFSPDDKTVVTAAYKNISFWEVATGKLVRTIKTPSVKDIGFSPDGKILISTEDNLEHVINLWDAATGTLKNSLRTTGEPVKKFSFSGDSKYLAASDVRKTVIWDLAAARIYKTLGEGDAAVFDNTNTYVLSSSDDAGNINVYNLKTWELVSKFRGGITGWVPFVRSSLSNLISNDNKYIACFQGNDIAVVNYLTGAPLKKITNHSSLVKDVVVSSKGNFIAFSRFDDRKIRVLDGNTGKIIITIEPAKEFWFVTGLRFTNDESKLIISDKEDARVYETQTGKLVHIYQTGTGHVSNYALTSPDDKLLITASKELKAWDFITGKLLYSLQGSFTSARNASFSKDGKLIGVPAFKELLILEAATGKNIRTFNKTISNIEDCSFSPDGKYLVVADQYKLAYIYELETGKLVRKLDKHTHDLNSGIFSPDGKYIITTAVNGESIVWDAKDATTAVADPWKDTTAKVIARLNLEKATYRFTPSFSFTRNWMLVNANSEIAFYDLQTMKKTLGWVGIDEEDYIIYLPGNYYTATPNAARWVNWKIGSTLYDFDQWDIKYNRPDIILKALQNKDTALINAYGAAYGKRLKKMGLDSAMFRDDHAVPEVQVAAGYPAVVSQVNKIKLKIKAREPLSNTYLQKIFVTVNGNPVYGKNGYDIPKKNSTETSLEVTIPLNTGANQVKVSCLNNRGAESLRKKINISYEPPQKPVPTVWYIGIGVSKYKNENFNLTYAAKDINDIAALLKSKYTSFEPVLILNENATLENIRAINQRLLKETKPDDVVIISLSGHGLIDKEFNFFFATHDIDFDKPGARGLSVDDLDLLLDKVVASKKLVLMDACHSGELDVDETVLATATAGDKNVKPGSRGGIIIAKKTELKTRSAFELLQELFTTTNASSGATIISAAGGTEYAYEGQSWNNGVFTFCILSSLKEMKADSNKDGGISISELQKYVSKQVKELTGGKQKPTSRQINYENDWTIWQ